MNRIDRLNAIMIHLQSKPRVTIHELEERYELTRRTIFRDIRALLDAGVPIGGNAGDGYFIVEGYHLPPVVFNQEEASAILLGAKLIEHNADASTSMAFQNALTKVKAVLRYADKEYLDELEKRISILPGPSLGKNGFPDSHIAEVQYAIASSRVLDISYYSNYNDQTTQREVEPLGLVHYTGRWHLIGFCRLRQDLRDFRTDRIKSLKITSEDFDPSKHPDYLDFLMDSMRGTDAIEVRVAFTKYVSRFIQDQKFSYGLVDEKSNGDWIEMRFYTPSIDMFGRWLMSFGDQVRVLGPSSLNEKVLELCTINIDHHQKNSNADFTMT